MDPHNHYMDWEVYLGTAIDAMRSCGVEFAPGLTTRQIARAEAVRGFRFPPDLRSFLLHALPTGQGFPDWREPDSAFVTRRLEWPADGICFDIEHNDFWHHSWGAQPASLHRAQERARIHLRAVPFLIPIFLHRYLPAFPCLSGNPVLSVYQTDIICYGYDLPSYLDAEFHVPNPYPVPAVPRQIEFWSEFTCW